MRWLLHFRIIRRILFFFCTTLVYLAMYGLLYNSSVPRIFLICEAFLRLFLNTILDRIYCCLDKGTAYIGNNIVNSTAIELRPLFETLSLSLTSKVTATSRFPSFREYPRLRGFPLQFVTWNFAGNTPNGILTFRDLCTVINSAVQQRGCIGRSWHMRGGIKAAWRSIWSIRSEFIDEVVLGSWSTILRHRETLALPCDTLCSSIQKRKNESWKLVLWTEDVRADFCELRK